MAVVTIWCDEPEGDIELARSITGVPSTARRRYRFRNRQAACATPCAPLFAWKAWTEVAKVAMKTASCWDDVALARQFPHMERGLKAALPSFAVNVSCMPRAATSARSRR
jgi:hypothetical protein